MNPAWLLCAAVLLLDALLFGFMLDAQAPLQSALALAGAHAGACLLFSLTVLRLLPPTYRRPAALSGLPVLGVAFFIPVLGMLGWLACVVPALRHQRPAPPLDDWSHPPAPALPARPAGLRAMGAMGGMLRASELAGPLRYAADPDSRTAALIATLSLEDQFSVPLLRLALKDPEDDVRLLAYALLNRKEKAIEARIRVGTEQLQNVPSGQGFLQHKALAHNYWAFAQLGDPQGSARLLLCARAREHVQAALRLCPRDGGLQWLMGRILLVQLELEGAREAFEYARQSGIDARHIQPFLAEIAFLRQRYADVRGHLMQARPGERLQLNKASIYWERPANDALCT
ncbi:MAG: hypothetical protein JWP93_144 [Polaromonas sp.]|jgi:hypothetical protein|nr:hypothetical protein [Polaromonas sp.]